MAHYLVVANQTLGGEELDRALRERIGRGDAGFHVLVPMTAPRHESDIWSGGFDPYGGMTLAQIEEARLAMEQHEQAREVHLAEARRRAEERLRQMLDRIHEAGGTAEGSVGEDDPAAAVRSVLSQRSFDEVLVSTLPTSLSRWLKLDLPSRVARMTDTPVVTIEATDRPPPDPDPVDPPDDTG